MRRQRRTNTNINNHVTQRKVRKRGEKERREREVREKGEEERSGRDSRTEVNLRSGMPLPFFSHGNDSQILSWLQEAMSCKFQGITPSIYPYN